MFTDNEVRPGEKRISSMLYDAKNDRLITGCSVIDTWPLTRAIQDALQVPHTHDRPLSQVRINYLLHFTPAKYTYSSLHLCSKGGLWTVIPPYSTYPSPISFGPLCRATYRHE